MNLLRQVAGMTPGTMLGTTNRTNGMIGLTQVHQRELVLKFVTPFPTFRQVPVSLRVLTCPLPMQKGDEGHARKRWSHFLFNRRLLSFKTNLGKVGLTSASLAVV